jgi:Ca2+/Na+ antiporter
MFHTMLSFIAAPFLGMIICVPLVSAGFGHFSQWELFFAFGLFYAYGSEVVFGLPLYLIAKHFSSNPAHWQCVTGGVIAALPAVVAALIAASPERPIVITAMYLSFTIAVGAVSGSAFWIVRRTLNAFIARSPSTKNAL